MAWQGKTVSKPSSNTEETLSMKGEDTNMVNSNYNVKRVTFSSSDFM